MDLDDGRDSPRLPNVPRLRSSFGCCLDLLVVLKLEELASEKRNRQTNVAEDWIINTRIIFIGFGETGQKKVCRSLRVDKGAKSRMHNMLRRVSKG